MHAELVDLCRAEDRLPGADAGWDSLSQSLRQHAGLENVTVAAPAGKGGFCDAYFLENGQVLRLFRCWDNDYHQSYAGALFDRERAALPIVGAMSVRGLQLTKLIEDGRFAEPFAVGDTSYFAWNITSAIAGRQISFAQLHRAGKHQFQRLASSFAKAIYEFDRAAAAVCAARSTMPDFLDEPDAGLAMKCASIRAHDGEHADRGMRDLAGILMQNICKAIQPDNPNALRFHHGDLNEGNIFIDEHWLVNGLNDVSFMHRGPPELSFGNLVDAPGLLPAVARHYEDYSRHKLDWTLVYASAALHMLARIACDRDTAVEAHILGRCLDKLEERDPATYRSHAADWRSRRGSVWASIVARTAQRDYV